ncbi:F-box/WD repeat-containing protein 2 isoform X1 [Ictalurus punctatus]|uniref:F-box/WD repeat-containing protein 2 n=2 Tax=Ictalurus punctatus TaxID=7998 RepID=A0A2D0QCL1_ICTPU|nr:F-box/WD repeat-containing protein 2 isoform X1 [Ictalurus punctatus]XP_053533015.1 F-box/WD repeat-containing protein 2 isoform X1 [Ictalurus punctatus]XP_053533016.1 F-box/WD repeat-containing protein 2 isoform X1 [Ictalurus punctatus]XP_053533017.1 F-box/WD repeat-containing protein 2 isoform X1 [Ictalurus punctatus]
MEWCEFRSRAMKHKITQPSIGSRPHVPMEKEAFEGWLESVSTSFLALNDQQRNHLLDHLISLSGAVQLRHLSNGLEALLKRDFLRLLPLELAFYLLRWLDPQTLLTCCLVCKQWNKVVNTCTEVWQGVCRDLGWRIDDSIQDAGHWKRVYLKAKRRMKQLQEEDAFETSSLIGHSARVYALYYKDGLLCTGSDDLSAKLWDVRTGQCIYGIQTHTCATVKFDEQKLVTGSFDNTIACWEWSTGAKIQQFRGHTGAVFSVDYNDELDTLVSGSADFTVKVWALSAGACLNTLTGHTEWVTKVLLQKSQVESMMHSPGDYILLSADKYEIKVWPIGREINCTCLKTLSVSEDRSVCLQPRLQFDGRYIVCSSDLGVYQWDFASFDVLRVIKPHQDPASPSLLSFGEVFALLFDNHHLYVMDLRTEAITGRWPLPAYRKSKRGSSFLPGITSWLNGFDGKNDAGLVFATSMPDHSIHLVLWKENG